MKIAKANIEIKRQNGKLKFAKIVMPVWGKPQDDGFIGVDIPFFGLKTTVKSEEDIHTAVEEAVTLFCMNAEKFGKGLEAELKSLGWEINNQSSTISDMAFNVSERNPVIERVLNTGDQFANTFAIAC